MGAVPQSVSVSAETERRIVWQELEKDQKTEKRTEAGKGKEKGAADKGKEKAADIKGKQASTAHKGRSDKSKKAPDEPKSRTETAGNRPWRRTRQHTT